MTRLLITNGGPHPADKWAAISAAEICDLVQIDHQAISEAAAVARIAKPKLQSAIAEALMGHHDVVQKNERSAIEKFGSARLSHSIDPRDHVPKTLDEAVKAVVVCAAASPFKTHFAKPDVIEAVTGILGSHFASAMHIERGWHADGHTIVDGKPVKNHRHDPADPHVVAFRQALGHAG